MEYATNTRVYFLLFVISKLSATIQAQRVEAEQGNVAFPQKSPVSLSGAVFPPKHGIVLED